MQNVCVGAGILWEVLWFEGPSLTDLHKTLIQTHKNTAAAPQPVDFGSQTTEAANKTECKITIIISHVLQQIMIRYRPKWKSDIQRLSFGCGRRNLRQVTAKSANLFNKSTDYSDTIALLTLLYVS